MKKIILTLICSFLISSAAVNAENNIDVFLNGNALTFDQQPIIKDCRTFVPVRKIFESFGMEVEWNEENKNIYAHNDDKKNLNDYRQQRNVGKRRMHYTGCRSIYN